MIMLLTLAVSRVVVAQTGTGGSVRQVSSCADRIHLQPTPKTVPADVYNDPEAKENAKLDAILDRKIRGICRGC
jgi:hypothetical protein